MNSMSDMNRDRPLLAQQRRRLLVGSALLVVTSLIILFPGFFSALFGVAEWLIALLGVVAFATLSFWMAYGMRCPVCRLNLFWYAVGHAKSGNWLNWLLSETTCPQCGYSSGKGEKVKLSI